MCAFKRAKEHDKHAATRRSLKEVAFSRSTACVLVQEVFKEHTSMLQQEDALPVRAHCKLRP